METGAHVVGQGNKASPAFFWKSKSQVILEKNILIAFHLKLNFKSI